MINMKKPFAQGQINHDQSGLFWGPILILLVALVVSSFASPVLAQWPTTAWSVSCSEKTGENVVGPIPCDDKMMGSAAVHRRDLEIASEWLEGMGFRAPRVAQIERFENQPYFAMIADEELKPDAGGKYNLPEGSIPNGTMYLSSSIMGDSLGGESVHEVFHAVQQAYQNISSFYPDTSGFTLPDVPYLPEVTHSQLLPGYRWITEGTADAIRIEFGRHIGASYTGRPSRHYDSPLYDPCQGCDVRLQRLQGYDTANFWLHLGEMLGGSNRVAYLETLWSKISEDPDIAHYGLGPLDSALQDLSAKGLAHHYPEFIARYANDEEKFSSVQELTFRAPEVEVSVDAEVEPVAADAYRIRIYIPVGQDVEVTIDFAQDHPDLHLIVDGQRMDTPEPGKDRNTLLQTYSGQTEPYEFLVRVANVAENAIETEKRPYGLRVSAPLPPLVGNLLASFDGNVSDYWHSFGLTSHGSTHWTAILNIETGEPVADPFNANRLVYPDDGSTFQMSGEAKFVSCQRSNPSICNHWTEETYRGVGPIVIGRGDLEIYSEDGKVWLKASLPVSTTITDHSLVERIETIPTRWNIGCVSSDPWWHFNGLQHAHFIQGGRTPALEGNWTSDDHLEISFECTESWDGEVTSTGKYNASMQIQGQVEVKPQ